MFRVRSLRPCNDSLSMSARSGRKPRAATLGPWRARDPALSREESASAYQHDNDHDDQDKYKCSSSNEHGYFFLSLGGYRVSESAVRAESTLGLGSVSGSIGTV